MGKPQRFMFIVVMIFILLLAVGNLVMTVQASKAEPNTPTPTGTPSVESTNPRESIPVTSLEQQDEIESIIQNYFELRYQSLSTLQLKELDDLGNLVSDGSDGKNFLKAELGKLAIEIKRAELYRLKYVSYKYFLDFHSIDIDAFAQMATVLVSEGNEVIYESSPKDDTNNVLPSHMYDLKHTIILRKEQDQWKIISDKYNDYLWRSLRETGMSADELLATLDASPSPNAQRRGVKATTIHALPEDVSTHVYDRAGAVDYALKWAYSHNIPTYDNYDGVAYGGDCTNFISQAIYEGGNASMAYSPANDQGIGTAGWYFTDTNHRARAWTHVDYFYKFVVTDAATENEGPEGYELEVQDGEYVPNGLMLGDVIQYDKNGDDEYDHAVIVVDWDANGDPLVASHSNNYDRTPYTTFAPRII